MKTVQALTLATTLALLSIDCDAGGQTNWATPSRIDIVRGEGLMVYGAFGNPNACVVADRLFVQISHPQYKEIYASLMLAFASGKQVMAYANECAPATWYTVPSTTYNTLTVADAFYMQD